jgi:hypothetical protein
MLPKRPERERHRLIDCLSVHIHRMTDAVVAGERNCAGPGGHEDQNIMFALCSPYVRQEVWYPLCTIVGCFPKP